MLNSEIAIARKSVKELMAIDRARIDCERIPESDIKSIMKQDSAMSEQLFRLLQAAYTLLNFPRESIESRTRVLAILGAGGRQSIQSRVSRHKVDLTDLFVAQECLALLRRITIKKLENEGDLSETAKKIHVWVGLTAKEVIKRKMKNVVSNWMRPEEEEVVGGGEVPRASKWRQARTSTMLAQPKKRISELGMPKDWAMPKQLGEKRGVGRKSLLKPILKKRVENVELIEEENAESEKNAEHEETAENEEIAEYAESAENEKNAGSENMGSANLGSEKMGSFAEKDENEIVNTTLTPEDIETISRESPVEPAPEYEVSEIGSKNNDTFDTNLDGTLGVNLDTTQEDN